LSAGVSSTQSQVSADLGEITTLQATVAALEAPVSGHAGGVSGSALSSTDVTALVALGAIASALGAFWAGRRSRPPRADGGS
jgi:hypothetical protein